MATAFYNVADPNNAFAVHGTTMIKQELGFECLHPGQR